MEVLIDKRMKKRSGIRMRRPCDRCEQYFVPQTKHTRICDKCHAYAMRHKRKKNAS